jgi:hypothetical protein
MKKIIFLLFNVFLIIICYYLTNNKGCENIGYFGYALLVIINLLAGYFHGKNHKKHKFKN